MKELIETRKSAKIKREENTKKKGKKNIECRSN